MIDRKTRDAAAIIVLASVAGLATGYYLGESPTLRCVGTRSSYPRAVVWVFPCRDGTWMIVGTGVLYGVYALAIIRDRITGAICVVGFHAFFVVAFAAIVLIFGSAR